MQPGLCRQGYAARAMQTGYAGRLCRQGYADKAMQTDAARVGAKVIG